MLCLAPIAQLGLSPDLLLPSGSRNQETERLLTDPAPGIFATPHEDNLRYFDVVIQGPDGSPFQSKIRTRA